MTRSLILRPLLPLLALPLAAQSYADAPAFGGSLVFSEGLNPMGSAARYERAGKGFAAGYEDGDAKARGFLDAAEDLDQGLLSADAALQLKGLQGLAERPEALRRKAYGISWTEQGGLVFAYQREETKGLLFQADADPTHVGSGLGANASQVFLRRTMVDRVILGAGSSQGPDGASFGVRLRLEHVAWGQGDPAQGLGFGAVETLLDPKIPTVSRASVANLDAGYELPLAQSLKVGLTADHLVPHRYWAGVEAKAQFRAGLELALGPQTSLRVESDLNDARRMPLPVDHRSASASLRMDLGGTLLRIGAERRKAADQAWTTAGASLSFLFSGTRVGFGFQFGDDRPQRAAFVRFDG
jgi:hypothetical protein